MDNSKIFLSIDKKILAQMMCKQLENNVSLDEISIKENVKQIIYKKYEEFLKEANELKLVEIDPFNED